MVFSKAFTGTRAVKRPPNQLLGRRASSPREIRFAFLAEFQTQHMLGWGGMLAGYGF